MKFDELTVFTSYLAHQLERGATLTESFAALAKETRSPSLRSALDQIGQAIASGQTLSQAMAPHTRLFPPAYTHFIRIGEKHSVLPQVLAILARSLKNLFALQSKVSASTSYLKFLLVLVPVMCLAVLGLSFVIQGQFAQMFGKMGVELPALTQLVLNLPYLLLPIGLLVTLAAGFAWNNRRLRHWLDLNMPFFGHMNRLRHFADLFAMLALLVKIKVPLTEALRETAALAKNDLIQANLAWIAQRVEAGEALGDILQAATLFPQALTSQICRGEEAGTMEEVLDNITAQVLRDLSLYVTYQTHMRVFAVLVFLGLFVPVSLCLVALYLPMFSVIGAIQG